MTKFLPVVYPYCSICDICEILVTRFPPPLAPGPASGTGRRRGACEADNYNRMHGIIPTFHDLHT